MKRFGRGEVVDEHVEVLLAVAVDLARARGQRRRADLLLDQLDDAAD